MRKILLSIIVGVMALASRPALAQFGTQLSPAGCYGTTTATANACVQRDGNANASANNVFTNSTSTAGASGTTVLTASSSATQVLTGSSPQTFQLPDARTLTAGSGTFYFNNNSSAALTIVDASSGTIYVAPAGGYIKANLLSNGTAAGSWDVRPNAPSIASWGSGTTGLQMNNALNTTAQIGSGASSCTAPNLVPQRVNSTTGFGSSASTNVCAAAAGTTTFTSTATLFSLPAGAQYGIAGAGIPYFSGTLSGSSQTVSNATWTKVNLDTVVDPNGYWNATNHNWVPLLAGKYEICAGVYALGTTVTQLFVAVGKNGAPGTGTTVAKGFNEGLATAPLQAAVAPCQIVTMNGSTDTLELDANITGTGATLGVNNDLPTSLFIRWVGP